MMSSVVDGAGHIPTHTEDTTDYAELSSFILRQNPGY